MSTESIEELLATAQENFRTSRDAWIDIRDQLQKAALPAGTHEVAIPRAAYLMYDALSKRLDAMEAEMQMHILTIHSKLNMILEHHTGVSQPEA